MEITRYIEGETEVVEYQMDSAQVLWTRVKDVVRILWCAPAEEDGEVLFDEFSGIHYSLYSTAIHRMEAIPPERAVCVCLFGLDNDRGESGIGLEFRLHHMQGQLPRAGETVKEYLTRCLCDATDTRVYEKITIPLIIQRIGQIPILHTLPVYI